MVVRRDRFRLVETAPMTGPTPSVVKKSGEMRMTFSCWVEPVSPTTSVSSRKMDRLENAGMLPRRS